MRGITLNNIVYDSFVPNMGVGFSEHGKVIKEAAMTLCEHTGRMSKSKFRSMLCDASSGSYLPDLTQTRFLESEHNRALGNEVVKQKPKIRFDKSLPAGFHHSSNTNLSGDVNSLLIDSLSQSNLSGMREQIVSSMPTFYIPPRFRKNAAEKKPPQSEPENQEFDLNKLSVIDTRNLRQIKLKPIIKGLKATEKQIQSSLGILKKLPRIREMMNKTFTHLPPPKVGSSLGHGIIQQLHQIMQDKKKQFINLI